FLKGVWTPSDRLRIETTLTHEPQESQHFTINAMQGDFLMESGGSAAGTVLTWRGDHSTQTHRINWSRMRHSRTGGPGWYQVWYYSEDDKKWGDPSVDGPWGTMFGTFGNIHQGQSNLEYRFKQEWDPLDTAAVSHRLAIGAHIGEAKGWYERKQDHTQGVPWEWAPTFTCTDVNGQVDDRHCSTAPVLHLPEGWPAGSGQMAMARNIFRAGKIDITQQQWSVWAEDAMKIRRFDLRLGARVDSDDYMDQ